MAPGTRCHHAHSPSSLTWTTASPMHPSCACAACVCMPTMQGIAQDFDDGFAHASILSGQRRQHTRGPRRMFTWPRTAAQSLSLGSLSLGSLGRAVPIRWRAHPPHLAAPRSRPGPERASRRLRRRDGRGRRQRQQGGYTIPGGGGALCRQGWHTRVHQRKSPLSVPRIPTHSPHNRYAITGRHTPSQIRHHGPAHTITVTGYLRSLTIPLHGGACTAGTYPHRRMRYTHGTTGCMLQMAQLQTHIPAPLPRPP